MCTFLPGEAGTARRCSSTPRCGPHRSANHFLPFLSAAQNGALPVRLLGINRLRGLGATVVAPIPISGATLGHNASQSVAALREPDLDPSVVSHIGREIQVNLITLGPALWL
jgi:hypothetical protein